MAILTVNYCLFYVINIDYPALTRWSVWKCILLLYSVKEVGTPGNSRLWYQAETAGTGGIEAHKK
jgi:hypothetical protein